MDRRGFVASLAAMIAAPKIVGSVVMDAPDEVVPLAMSDVRVEVQRDAAWRAYEVIATTKVRGKEYGSSGYVFDWQIAQDPQAIEHAKRELTHQLSRMVGA